jgi:hypothetical protein
MRQLNPYAPPGFGAQLEGVRERSRVVPPTDPDAVRRAHLWSERVVLSISGLGYVCGVALLAWGIAVLWDDGARELIAALILFALASLTLVGARWLSCRQPRGRWCASALALLCTLCLVPAAWVAISLERHYWPLVLLVLVPANLLVALWLPGVNVVLSETYRRAVIPQTPHLEPPAALLWGGLAGIAVVGYVVLTAIRL